MAQLFSVDCDPGRLDLERIHGFLTQSYWARGIPLETVQRSLKHSLNFGLYRDQEQIGFARCVTDRATFAYLADVFVLEEYRGQGLGRQLLRAVMQHPELQGLRRWMLTTRDAHDIYRSFGFQDNSEPSTLMELLQRDPYCPTNHVQHPDREN